MKLWLLSAAGVLLAASPAFAVPQIPAPTVGAGIPVVAVLGAGWVVNRLLRRK